MLVQTLLCDRCAKEIGPINGHNRKQLAVFSGRSFNGVEMENDIAMFDVCRECLIDACQHLLKKSSQHAQAEFIAMMQPEQE